MTLVGRSPAARWEVVALVTLASVAAFATFARPAGAADERGW